MLLKTFTVRGGDFAAGKRGFFHPLRSDLSLPKKSGSVNDLMSNHDICHTALATPEAISLMGGEQRFGDVGTLFRVLSNLSHDDAAFVVQFNNDKVLLATTDHETCIQIVKLQPVPARGFMSRIRAMG